MSPDRAADAALRRQPGARSALGCKRTLSPPWGHRRQVADVAVDDQEEGGDGGLVGRDRV